MNWSGRKRGLLPPSSGGLSLIVLILKFVSELEDRSLGLVSSQRVAVRRLS